MKAGALRRIALAPPVTADRAGALEILQAALGAAGTILGENEKVDALGGIATAQAEAGEIPGAFKTIAMIENAYKGQSLPDVAVATKAEALRAIAIAQAKAGDSQTALQTAGNLVDPYLQASALAEIAVVQSKKGDRDASVKTLRKALQSAAGIQELHARGPALLAVGQAQAKIGEQTAAVKAFRQARQTVRASADERYKTEALLEVASVQARAGDFQGAVETADGIQDLYAQANAWREIAMARSGNGNANGMLAWTVKQNAPVKKAYALLGIAEGLLLQ
jgi:tetratricopeptide (TPR) repeat protein